MNYYQTRRYIDKLKYEKDYAEYLASGIKQRGNEKGHESTEYKDTTDRAGVINRLMDRRGE
jgi:hypothetical protein